MYTISVQILGERQLRRVNPDLVSTLRRQLVASAEVQGASFHEHGSGRWLFAFERADADDRQGVVEATLQFKQILSARSAELSGWLTFVDFLAVSTEHALAAAEQELASIYVDDLVLLSDRVVSMLDSHLEVEEIVSGARTLLSVTGRHAHGGSISGSVEALAIDESTVDALLELLAPQSHRLRPVLLSSPDPSISRAHVRAAQAVLVADDPAFPILCGEYAGDREYASAATLFDLLNLHQTPFWLSRAEQRVWAGVRASVEFVRSPGSSNVVPDALGTDLYLALDLYLKSYARRMVKQTSLPLVVCYEIDHWDQSSLDLLVRASSRLSEPQSPTLLYTTSRGSAAGIASLDGERVRAGVVTVSRVRDYLVQAGLLGQSQSANWQRISRVSAGRADTVVQYLVSSRHWDELEETKIHEVTPADIAWRAVSEQDSDVREVLLALHYLCAVTTAEQFLSLAGSLGVDSARVPAILTHLAHLGLVTGERWVRPVHPELRSRLEINLGTSARTVADRVGHALHRAVLAGEVVASLPVIDVLRDCRRQQFIPAVYGRMVSQLIDRRELAAAHAALYDSVPAAAFSSDSRGAMQGVILTNRLRLSLIQQNRQAGTRALGALDSDEISALPGDTVLFRSRHAAGHGDMKRSVALLKQAIVEYQDNDDETGLARANLDYGMVKLSQEDLSGGREYIRMAAMAADDTQDVLERLRAGRLLVTTEFLSGNLSRANDLGRQLLQMAGAAAMHESELFALLALGRAAFELGRYQEAGTMFGRGRMVARLYGFSAAELVMQRWLARCNVYEGRLSRAIEVFSTSAVCCESQFFLAEALLRRGDHSETLRTLERAAELEVANTVTPEMVCWDSGFSPIEDLAIGVHRGDRVLRNQINALRGYVLAESGNVEEGLHEMYRLTRDMGMSDLDPYNRVYFYLYSLIIPESGELRLEDPATVLGKAVRYIQQRTSRMELYDDKTDYLRKNYWNALLVGRAQVHNLV